MQCLSFPTFTQRMMFRVPLLLAFVAYWRRACIVTELDDSDDHGEVDDTLLMEALLALTETAVAPSYVVLLQLVLFFVDDSDHIRFG